MAVYWPLEGGWDDDITSERWNLDPRAKAVWVYRSGIGHFRVPFPTAVYPDQNSLTFRHRHLYANIFGRKKHLPKERREKWRSRNFYEISTTSNEDLGTKFNEVDKRETRWRSLKFLTFLAFLISLFVFFFRSIGRWRKSKAMKLIEFKFWKKRKNAELKILESLTLWNDKFVKEKVSN